MRSPARCGSGSAPRDADGSSRDTSSIPATSSRFARSSRPSVPAPSYSPRRDGASLIAVAAVVATVAFWAYSQTLLPGVDLGDTGGFQAAVLWPEVSARQAYPLYYNLARPFVRAVSVSNPARGVNLFSAVAGAAAAGLLTLLCALITQSVVAGAAAGLFL